jgi:hypothetical protein
MKLQGKKNLASDLERFSNDAKFFDRNYPGLKEDYSDEYVAVYNETVVGHDKNLSKLIEKIENPRESYIGYVSKKNKTLILIAV